MGASDINLAPTGSLSLHVRRDIDIVTEELGE